MSQNRLWNATNPGQGRYKRVLCVCSAGILRSPTAALVLSQEPFGFNTRAAGIEPSYALIVVDRVLMEWADEAVVMTPEHEQKMREIGFTKPIIRLDIEDDYQYRDPSLMALIKQRYFERTAVAS